MYCRHRIRLMFPRLKCLIESTKSGHQKYYPLELVEIYEDEDKCGYQSSEIQRLLTIDVKADEKPEDEYKNFVPKPHWYNQSYGGW